ncbi:hypothetical protein GQ53DRAFT_747105 [Thozetella sp. PMI_491]|nr:hypothetical protein GQ53DRAFT_747105 [Thozetella sp. PMI_491]
MPSPASTVVFKAMELAERVDMDLEIGSISSDAASMDMSTMEMTFFQSITTALFWQWWRPTGAGQYAATCVFLVVLAVLTRAMLALKPVLEETVWRGEVASAPLSAQERDLEDGVDSFAKSLLASDTTPIENTAQRSTTKVKNLPDGGGSYLSLSQGLVPVQAIVRGRWRGATMLSRLLRALYESVLAGMGYLLMLAVMTMNVGYFFSVLGGIFLGTFLLGNLTVDGVANRWDHC